jgi:5-methylcytosine-specific restriction enzyme A
VADPVYNTLAWRRVRLLVLERDGHQCRVRGPGCRGRAEVVDHIWPVKSGGAWYALENLRACCRSCNTARAYQAFELRRGPSREW